MIGAIALLVFMVVVFPVGFLMSAAAASALHGMLLSSDAEDRHNGSELVALSK